MQGVLVAANSKKNKRQSAGSNGPIDEIAIESGTVFTEKKGRWGKECVASWCGAVADPQWALLIIAHKTREP